MRVAPGRSPTVAVPTPTRAALRAARRRENFPIAAFVLRPARRRERHAIYDFCRLVDDVGDELAGDRVAALEALRAELLRCWGGAAPTHPVLAALRPVIAAHRLDPDPFLRLVEANLQDQRVAVYRTWAELDEYCTRSATPVGELVLALEGLRDAQRRAWSDAITTGLQLANMWQDIAADRERGRCYLPTAVLRAHGASEAAWWAGRPTPELRAALHEGVARARARLLAGLPLAASVRGPLRVELATFALCGLDACQAVLDAGDRVFTAKARIPRAARWRTLGRALRAARHPERLGP